MIVLDSIWMLVLPENKGVVYAMGRSAKEVWDQVIDGERLGTGVTKAELQKKGYRAKKVDIVLPQAKVNDA